MILKQNGFDYVHTPTNLRHIKYLQDQDDLIKGTTLNSNLYVSKEGKDAETNQKQEVNVSESEDLDQMQNNLIKKKKLNRVDTIEESNEDKMEVGL